MLFFCCNQSKQDCDKFGVIYTTKCKQSKPTILKQLCSVNVYPPVSVSAREVSVDVEKLSADHSHGHKQKKKKTTELSTEINITTKLSIELTLEDHYHPSLYIKFYL